MIKVLNKIGFLFVAVMLAACNSQPTAEEVLQKSYQKCQSIQEGHYKMTLKKKWMSHNDTTVDRYTCDFRKLPNDTIYGKAFNSYEESWDSDNESWDSGWSYHFLYTGNEYASFNDSTGTFMPRDLWAADIIRGTAQPHILHAFDQQKKLSLAHQ